MRKKSIFVGTLGACILALAASAAHAVADSVSVRAGVEGGYDSNVYRVDVGELGKRGSWTFGLHPTVEWRPSAHFSLTYAGEAAFFLDENGEDHARHTVTLRYAEAGRFLLQSATTRVQGPRDAVLFADGRNAWATTLVRERRDQWQNRTRVEGTVRRGDFFVRPSASLVYFDLDSRVRTGVPGYDNWTNRFDLQGGLDLGRELESGEIYVGWHRGRQHQGDQGGRPTTRSNKYHRLFLGFSGTPTEALTLDAEAGPSFHRYDDPASVGPSAIDAWYVNVRARLRISDQDTVTANASMSKAVASTGLLSSEVRSFGAAYTRQWDDGSQLRVHGGARGLVYDGSLVKDWIYSAGIGWARDLGENLRLNLDLVREEGRDDRDGPAVAAREFTRTIASARLDYRF
ncbi:MAG: hypothetical protein JJU00_11020 [Opitutales bacterium]|nr:hypothetical protein [Opitutales bacterium]